MSKAREVKIRGATKQALIYALKDALEGDEAIFKEVWEDCADEEELGIADKEIARIIRLLLQEDKR